MRKFSIKDDRLNDLDKEIFEDNFEEDEDFLKDFFEDEAEP